MRVGLPRFDVAQEERTLTYRRPLCRHSHSSARAGGTDSTAFPAAGSLALRPMESTTSRIPRVGIPRSRRRDGLPRLRISAIETASNGPFSCWTKTDTDPRLCGAIGL